MAKIGMFGAGYVGLVTGACFADLGHEVVIRDVVPERIEALRAGEIPIYEPGLELVIERNAERMSFTLDVHEAVDGADFLYIAVGTPPTESGDADLRAVFAVVDELPSDIPGRPIVVMKSTVPVGTGANVRNRLDSRGLTNVGYVSNPEFLAEGSAVRDFMNPDRIVVGAFEEGDGDRVVGLHRGIEAEVVRTDVPSAELVKLAANAFLSTRISFINEIANVCELVGADVVDVAKGVGLDHRLGPHFLRAGIGFGGSCFPKDVTALKQLAGNSGYQFMLLHAVWEVNELQKRRVIQKLQKHLGSLRGKTVALLGLAFKPNTDDMREAPSRVIAYRLLSEGADVRAWDPVAQPADLLQGIELCESVLDAVRDADAAVIVTEWPELANLASDEVRDAMARPVIIDGRNLLDPAAAQAAGFVYEGIGRPRHASPIEPDRTRGPGASYLMEALLLAGGKAERLGEAAQGLPKPLVPIAGFPLAEYGVGRLVEAGVTRVIVACRAGQEEAFVNALAGLGAEIDAVGEPEPLGRGGGLRLAASRRREDGAVSRAERRRAARRRLSRAARTSTSGRGAAATIVVAQVRSPFGVVELQDDGRVTGFREAPLLDGLGQLRRLRARRGGARTAAREGRPRAEHLSRARGRGEARAATATTASG